MNAPPTAVALLGPTASGKSALALELAKRWPLEIVSVDSAQVYRGMDVGTAKPSLSTREHLAHHLIDVCAPTESYSAARFAQDTVQLIGAIRARGKLPLLVGGTMLYFKALREGLDPLPAATPLVRSELDARARISGWPALHAELARIDPPTAARLQPNDAQRIQRALEVHAVSGQPMSTLLRGQRAEPLIDLIQVGLLPNDRVALHEAIARRFGAMLDAGLVEELVALRQHHSLQPDLPSMRCVGYRQAWMYLDGDGDQQQLFDRGVAATRQLAKRQMTWMRAMPHLTPFDPDQTDVLSAVARHVEIELGSRST